MVAAARLVRAGRRFNLDYEINAFEPYPTGTRRRTEHHVFADNEFHRDDWLDSFYLQSTSQLDALRHIGHPEHGFDGGLPAAANHEHSTALGIHGWAQAGIAGRGVLLDVPRFFEREGLPYGWERTIALDEVTLDAIARAQGVTWQGGDMLLLRTGRAENHVAKSYAERVEFNRRNRSRGSPSASRCCAGSGTTRSRSSPGTTRWSRPTPSPSPTSGSRASARRSGAWTTAECRTARSSRCSAWPWASCGRSTSSPPTAPPTGSTSSSSPASR